nr:hypothetical protein BaRGS_016304 [Batillaria attramentaria]
MGVYNCSPPYIAPEELQCDGIMQCLGGEDELGYDNSSYTQHGCDEGWIAGGSLCLKFVTTPITPDQAKIECRETYNADLGSLLHPGVRRLVARRLLRTNHSEMIVGLERVLQAGSLYRFLWRWTQAGTEFDGPQPHQADKNMSCATLTQEELDLSYNNLSALSGVTLTGLHSATHLDLSNNPLLTYLDAEFRSFLKKSGGNEIPSISRNMFSGLSQLKILETDDPSLCCPYFFLYGDETMDCRTPIDELSSCNDLLRSDFFRGFLWTLSAMAISGNIGVLVYRVFLETQGSSSGFRVLVANLCVADSLMGVYLVITGSADAYYSGQYIWKREAWTRSNLCQTAGFLALLSSELSAFLICLITLDRLLVLQFPLHRHLHLSTRSATMTCGASWLVGIILAAVPLMPAEWTFYGQTGICLPLPITRKPFLGQHYAFGVFVILNFLLFVLIGAGQLLIYHAIRNASIASRSNRRKQDMAIARRLSLIVFTDFCCWFPIGMMGLLAFHDTPIPGEVNVWAAIFILPVNSAINPFLYTLSMLVERWLKRREEKRLAKTLARLHADMITWSDTKTS